MRIFILLFAVVFLNGCNGMKNHRTVDYKTMGGGYAEYSILPQNAGIVVRSGDYWMDSFRIISRYKVEKCSTRRCYYVTYYLTDLFETPKPEIIRFKNGTIEVTIDILDFCEDFAVYYKGTSGVYPIKRGDEDSWTKYWDKYLLELKKERGGYEYADPANF